MRRAGVLLTAFVVLSAWAGAQVSAGPTAADRLRLLRANRAVLADLVEAGAKQAGRDHPVDRAAACAEAMRAVGRALGRAAADPAADPARVAELGGHLTAVVRDGLVPVLDDARRTIPEGSPRADELKALRAKAAGDLAEFRGSIPAAGAVADDAGVKDVAAGLDRLREKLK